MRNPDPTYTPGGESRFQSDCRLLSLNQGEVIMMDRPEPSEYFEYYGRYVNLVPEGDIISVLESELQRTLDMLEGVPEELEEYKYQPGKWSVREVIGHVIDAERVFQNRAFHFARRDPAPLPSMEENDYARVSNAGQRPLQELAQEFEAVRRSSIALFRSFDDEVALRRGTASGNEFSVRSTAYIMAGHEIHHRSVLENRYLQR